MEITNNITSPYVLKLYITGTSPNSTRAVNNTKAFCEKYLKERYELQVIDVYQQPLTPQKEQIIALPLLIKSLPLPQKKIIGNMSDAIKVKQALDLNDIMDNI